MTTLSVAPVLVWAITLRVFTCSTFASAMTVAVPVSDRSLAPSALVTLITGIVISSLSSILPLNIFSSTSLAMTTATAPRSVAATAFSDR